MAARRGSEHTANPAGTRNPRSWNGFRVAERESYILETFPNRLAGFFVPDLARTHARFSPSRRRARGPLPEGGRARVVGAGREVRQEGLRHRVSPDLRPGRRRGADPGPLPEGLGEPRPRRPDPG